MPTVKQTQAPSPLKRYVLPAGVGILLAVGLYFYFDHSEAPPAQETAAPKQTAAFGPGALSNADNGESLNKRAEAAPLLSPPGGLAVTPDQQLQINTALHDVIDFFLLQQPDANRMAALQNYLKSKLPGAAYSQALQTVEHYQAYMQAHDTLLASQNLGTVNAGIASLSVERLTTWREQRDRMRLSMLGDQLVQVWYSDDDNRFSQALEQLQQLKASAQSDGHSLSNQGEESQEIQSAIASEITSYSTRAQDEQQWAAHFQSYVEVANHIKQQRDLSFAQRENQLQQELRRLFSTDAQRQKARDMGPDML